MSSSLTTLAVLLANLVLAALLALVFRILLEDRVAALLVRYFGGLAPSRRRRITGIWYSVYWYWGINDEINKSTHLLKFKNLGSWVSAQTISGPHNRYQMRGRLKYESHITGTWDNIVGDNVYHGAFQTIIEPEGDIMSGRWLGFNKRHVIGGGPWIMVRITKDVSRDAEEEVRSETLVEGRDEEIVFHKETEHKIAAMISRQSPSESMPRWHEVAVDT